MTLYALARILSFFAQQGCDAEAVLGIANNFGSGTSLFGGSSSRRI
jgi:hypothetical protein